jgi:hypothetical protein
MRPLVKRDFLSCQVDAAGGCWRGFPAVGAERPGLQGKDTPLQHETVELDQLQEASGPATRRMVTVTRHFESMLILSPLYVDIALLEHYATMQYINEMKVGTFSTHHPF